MFRLLLSLLLTTTCSLMAFGQLGGGSSFEFLNLPSSARITGLGGNLITVLDDDINLAFANPALLNESMHHQLSFNHGFLPAGIQFGYVGFGQHISKWGTTFHGGIQYISYGDFDARDIYNQLEGTFKAGEYAITLGAAYPVYDRLTLGLNTKLISSSFESYNSLALSTDMAAVYYNEESRFTATLLFKNIGTQLNTYSEDVKESLPYDVQFGFSKKLVHLPFRFSIVYHHLDRWNITYDDPNQEDEVLFLGEEPTQQSEFSKTVDNLFRHLVFNGEFLIGKKENLRVRFGYNHFMNKELSVSGYRSLRGFSFGFGMKINRFRIDYGHLGYHQAGGIHQLGISTNLSEFK